MGWKAYIDIQDWQQTARLFLVNSMADGNVAVKIVETDPIPEGVQMAPAMEADIRYVRDMCEAIAEAAWERGWRPSSYADHRNELTATRDHLKDMQRIALAAVHSKFPKVD